MFITDIKRVIEQVSRDKGIDSQILISALEEALRSAARKRYGSRIDIEVKYSEAAGEIEVFQFREVVEEVTDPETHISMAEGKKLDPECEVGDSLGTKMDTSSFGRIAAQSAKQVIIQKMKDAERDAVYSTFIERKGEIINGIVQRVERNRDIIVNLGHTEGLLPDREQISREVYRRGDRIRAYILEVRHESRGPQVILSRSHPQFLTSLFRTEVPEISEGIVTIMGAAREAGSRSKFAVASNDSDIDPVGACVGMKGSRVQNVVQELRGEKIDIIPWHIDHAKFVCNALAPAEISRVIIDEENRSMEVIVPDDYLSVAIGRKGQNVRLASKLTKWRLDVKSESRYSRDMKAGYESLISLPGVGISLADALYEKGFYSAEEVSKATVEDLLRVRGIGEEKAGDLIGVAEIFVQNGGKMDPEEGEAASEPEPGEAPAENTDSAEAPAEDADSAEAPAEDADSAEEPAEDADSAEESAEDADSTEEPAEDADSAENPAEDTDSAAVQPDREVNAEGAEEAEAEETDIPDADSRDNTPEETAE